MSATERLFAPVEKNNLSKLTWRLECVPQQRLVANVNELVSLWLVPVWHPQHVGVKMMHDLYVVDEKRYSVMQLDTVSSVAHAEATFNALHALATRTGSALGFEPEQLRVAADTTASTSRVCSFAHGIIRVSTWRYGDTDVNRTFRFCPACGANVVDDNE